MHPAHRAYATISSVVFALVALAQAGRAIAGLPVRIGSFELPVAGSAAAAIVCAMLAVWGWRARRSV